MAYKRVLPSFNNEEKMTRTAVVNPDKSVTYKQSWSSSTPGTSSSSKKAAPSKRITSAAKSTVTKRSAPPIKTSGEREITSIPPMKSAGMKKEEIKASEPVAPKKVKTAAELRIEKYGPVGERVYGKGEEKQKYKTPEYVGKKTNKKAKKCTSC